MTNRDFDEWLSKFRPSISTYDYYVDFDKVYSCLLYTSDAADD